MMSIRFFENDNTIHCRVNSGTSSANKRFSTKIKTKGYSFSDGLFQGRSEYEMRMNARLKKIGAMFPFGIKSKTLDGAKSEVMAELGTKTSQVLEAVTTLSVFKEYLTSKEGTHSGSYSDVRTCYNKYKEFGHCLDLLSVDMYSATNRRDRQGFIQKIKSHINEYIMWMSNQGVKRTTQANYLTKLKASLREAESNHAISLWLDFKAPKENVQPITIPVTAVMKFMDKHLIADDDKEQVVWAVGYLSMVTTMRVGDIVNLTTDMVLEKNGVKYFKVANQKTFHKTGAVTICPIHDSLLIDVMVAVSKIENSRFSKTVIKRDVAEVLRDILSRYPEMQTVVPYYRQDSHGNLCVKNVKLYELCKMHMLRKTSITGYLDSGLAEKNTKGLSGHTANSKAFSSYVDHGTDKHFENVLQAQAKLFGL